jgi:hypothetical protein
MKSLSFILILFIFIDCNSNDEFDSLNNKVIKENIGYEQFIIVLETDNYNYIKQVLENYNIHINEVQNGITVLDRYEYSLNKKILELLRSYGAKNCKELKNSKCKKLNILDKLKVFISSNKKYKDRNIQRYVEESKSINDIIEYFILNDRYELLKFMILNIQGINTIWLRELIIIRNNDGSIKLGTFIKKYRKVLILDYAIKNNNKKIIKLLRKYGAKRACEILKTKCKHLNPDIEKILKNGENIIGDK